MIMECYGGPLDGKLFDIQAAGKEYIFPFLRQERCAACGERVLGRHFYKLETFYWKAPRLRFSRTEVRDCETIRP